ncbi:hypothetical protein ACOSQ2_006259 [Xanthoceras sorbifolium]
MSYHRTFRILKRDGNRYSFSLKAYMVELYQDTLIDLLLPRNAKRLELKIKKDAKGTMSVENVNFFIQRIKTHYSKRI